MITAAQPRENRDKLSPDLSADFTGEARHVAAPRWITSKERKSRRGKWSWSEH